MFDPNVLWEIVTQNAHHLQVMNREMGELASSIVWLKQIISWQFWCLGLILAGVTANIIFVIINLVLTKRNGKR